MNICSGYRRDNDKYGLCYGTREYELCTCQGDESKCDFYPEKREKAKKMTTLEMMNLAKEKGKTYRVLDMLYNTIYGFHDKHGRPWEGYAFNELNDLFKYDDWQEDPAYMTKSEAEAKYGIKIVGD